MNDFAAERQWLEAAEVFDTHIDTDIPARLWGRDPRREGRLGRWTPFFGHTDWPRLHRGGFDGAAYDLATWPFRGAGGRLAALFANVARVKALAAASPLVAVVNSMPEHRAARAKGQVALWLAVQGGNALSANPSALDGPLGAAIHRITLVHLMSSDIGGTSSPTGSDTGLTQLGLSLMAACHRNRVLVDLAHAGKRTFWDAIAAHDTKFPPVVTHTGVNGAYRSWRNLDDDQIVAIADRGGFVSVILHSGFLRAFPKLATSDDVARHLEHVVQVGGEDVVAFGSDWDGFILPPSDLPDCLSMPTLLRTLRRRNWTEQRIEKMLGLNVKRVLTALRPDPITTPGSAPMPAVR